MGDDFTRPRLMNFVSEEQLDQAKKTRGERVEDGTAYRDRPLFEILKENKDKKDAEFNERFKHRPPKALDDDETEFLDQWETSKKEYERQIVDEEAQQLLSFQAAVAAKSSIVQELTEIPSVPVVKEQLKPTGKRNPPAFPLGMIVKVKPQAKKAKTDQGGIGEATSTAKPTNVNTDKTLEVTKTPEGDADNSSAVSETGLVSYSDDSEDDL
uniref:protein FAM192A n=1 Tax=Fragaria vesca subsp. vesca TaxID=101020 RepID=UPI0005CA6F39|nr:PREDICTED: protein FAM192A [Fragaria vesca subsp. vesca]